MNTALLQEKIKPFIKLIPKLFDPPQPRLFGTCITHNSGNIQTHTPKEIITDPQSGQKYCDCPSSRHCIKEARVVAGAKPSRY